MPQCGDFRTGRADGRERDLVLLAAYGAVSRVGRGDLAWKQLGATASARGGGALLFLCESEPTV